MLNFFSLNKRNSTAITSDEITRDSSTEEEVIY